MKILSHYLELIFRVSNLFFSYLFLVSSFSILKPCCHSFSTRVHKIIFALLLCYRFAFTADGLIIFQTEMIFALRFKALVEFKIGVGFVFVFFFLDELVCNIQCDITNLYFNLVLKLYHNLHLDIFLNDRTLTRIPQNGLLLFLNIFLLWSIFF